MADVPLTRASLLVRLRNAQDEAAWAEFVQLYVPLLYRFLRRKGLQDADVADLSQEVLGAVAGAVRRLEYDPRKGAFRSWLFTIVRRRLSNWRDRQATQTRGSGDSAVHQLLEQSAADADVESEWETEWQRRVFAWACEQVRPQVRGNAWQAFWQTAVEGRSGKEVAADLGISVSAVYLARSRVFARLRKLVASVEEP
jgi:RNA polymerase sigma-70 factor (ECF subfamily)